MRKTLDSSSLEVLECCEMVLPSGPPWSLALALRGLALVLLATSCSASNDSNHSHSSCDNITAPTNGQLGNCSATLGDGEDCYPECDTGYVLSGRTTCSASVTP